MRWIYVLLGFISNAIASALIKLAVMPPRVPLSWMHWDALVVNFPLWLGVLMGCIAVLFYREALRRSRDERLMLLIVIGSVLLVTIVSWSFLASSVLSSLTLGLVLSVIGLLIIRIERDRFRHRHHH